MFFYYDKLLEQSNTSARLYSYELDKEDNKNKHVFVGRGFINSDEDIGFEIKHNFEGGNSTFLSRVASAFTEGKELVKNADATLQEIGSALVNDGSGQVADSLSTVNIDNKDYFKRFTGTEVSLDFTKIKIPFIADKMGVNIGDDILNLLERFMGDFTKTGVENKGETVIANATLTAPNSFAIYSKNTFDTNLNVLGSFGLIIANRFYVRNLVPVNINTKISKTLTVENYPLYGEVEIAFEPATLFTKHTIDALFRDSTVNNIKTENDEDNEDNEDNIVNNVGNIINNVGNRFNV